MEGELKDSDRKKRPRNEGKEEEMEALAAAVSARPRLVGPQNPFGESLLARPMPMEDIIRRSNETNLPAASATIPQILAGAFRCYSGTLSANTSRSSSLLPGANSLTRNQILLQNQLSANTLALSPASAVQRPQFNTLLQLEHLNTIRNNNWLLGRYLDRGERPTPSTFPASRFLSQLSRLPSSNDLMTRHELDYLSTLACSTTQHRRLSSETAIMTPGLSRPTDIRSLAESSTSTANSSCIPADATRLAAAFPNNTNMTSASAVASPTAAAAADSNASILTTYIPSDEDCLTPYQCLARKQIELFAAGPTEVAAGTHGRNRSVMIGQVGIRCRHCAHIPLRERARASTYYPAKLLGLYQAGQNMANSHLSQYCQYVPAKIRDEMNRLGNKKSAAGGGKDYWANGARQLGVIEDNHGLRFRSNGNQPW